MSKKIWRITDADGFQAINMLTLVISEEYKKTSNASDLYLSAVKIALQFNFLSECLFETIENGETGSFYFTILLLDAIRRPDTYRELFDGKTVIEAAAYLHDFNEQEPGKKNLDQLILDSCDFFTNPKKYDITPRINAIQNILKDHPNASATEVVLRLYYLDNSDNSTQLIELLKKIGVNKILHWNQKVEDMSLDEKIKRYFGLHLVDLILPHKYIEDKHDQSRAAKFFLILGCLYYGNLSQKVESLKLLQNLREEILTCQEPNSDKNLYDASVLLYHHYLYYETTPLNRQPDIQRLFSIIQNIGVKNIFYWNSEDQNIGIKSEIIQALDMPEIKNILTLTQSQRRYYILTACHHLGNAEQKIEAQSLIIKYNYLPNTPQSDLFKLSPVATESAGKANQQPWP